MTGSLIGAIVRDGQALFPHGDDVLQAGDRAILFTRVEPRARGRADALSPRARPAGGALGVDVLASLNLVGALLKYLSLAFALPGRRSRSATPSRRVAVPRRRRSSAAVRLGRRAADRGKDAVGVREGFLVVSLTWLARRRPSARCRTSLGRAISSRARSTRTSRRCPGSRRPGATVLTDIEALPDSLLIWRQLTQWLGGMGIIVLALAVLPRLRVGGRQLLEHELPGPRVRAARRRDPRHRAAALGCSTSG